MIMDRDEILRAYRNAKDQDKQITILAQLNAVGRSVMENYIKEQLASTAKEPAGQPVVEALAEPEKGEALKQECITKSSVTSVSGLPQEVKNRVYKRIAEDCSYAEYCEMTGLDDNRQTKRQYANLRSRARAEGYALKDQRTNNGAKTTVKPSAPEESEALFSSAQVNAIQNSLSQLKVQLSGKVAAITVLQHEKSKLEKRIEKLQKILDIIKE